MKEVIEKILEEYSLNNKQINFESVVARSLLADYIVKKINSGTTADESYNNESDTCCGGGCGCEDF
jgi:hypothetical protein